MLELPPSPLTLVPTRGPLSPAAAEAQSCSPRSLPTALGTGADSKGSWPRLAEGCQGLHPGLIFNEAARRGLLRPLSSVPEAAGEAMTDGKNRGVKWADLNPARSARRFTGAGRRPRVQHVVLPGARSGIRPHASLLALGAGRAVADGTPNQGEGQFSGYRSLDALQVRDFGCGIGGAWVHSHQPLRPWVVLGK